MLLPVQHLIRKIFSLSLAVSIMLIILMKTMASCTKFRLEHKSHQPIHLHRLRLQLSHILHLQHQLIRRHQQPPQLQLSLLPHENTNPNANNYTDRHFYPYVHANTDLHINSYPNNYGSISPTATPTYTQTLLPTTTSTVTFTPTSTLIPTYTSTRTPTTTPIQTLTYTPTTILPSNTQTRTPTVAPAKPHPDFHADTRDLYTHPY